MVLFNVSLEIGSWIATATNDITGSVFLTLLILLVFLIAIAMLFRTPMLMVFVLLIPLLIVFSEYDTTGGFTTILALVVIVIGWLMAKLFFAYR
jgi:hypothetical protein